MSEPSVFVSQVLPILAGLVLAGLLVALGFASKYLAERAKTSRWWLFLGKVNELVTTAVQRIEVEWKPKLASAAADGIITPEEGKLLREEAVKIVVSTGGVWLRKEAAAFGYVGQALTDWLLGKVETAVALMPQKVLAAQAASGGIVALPGAAVPTTPRGS